MSGTHYRMTFTTAVCQTENTLDFNDYYAAIQISLHLAECFNSEQTMEGKFCGTDDFKRGMKN